MKRLLFPLIALMASLAVGGCIDDDNYSTSPSTLLTFASDTVDLDTTFSNVPTPKRTVWVFNHTRSSVRLTSVRLENGNQTGFRANVDGVYLSPTAGYQASNLEILDGDSMQVVVELTSPFNRQPAPQRLEDALLFTLESGVVQRLPLKAYSWDALLMQGLDVTADTVIDTTQPVVFYGNLTVAPQATLTIAAGTTLYFHDNAGIDVYGSLVCQGEAGREVTLRGDRIDHMFDYLPYDRTPGRWQGIRLREQSHDNVLQHTDLHSAFNGIRVDSSAVDAVKLRLSSATIMNCQGDGLAIDHAWVTAENVLVANCEGHCLTLSEGRADVNHATLAQFYVFSSQRGSALHLANREGQGLQLAMTNSIVTGYADDVVSADVGDEALLDYRFADCLLRTPKVEGDDSVRYERVVFEETADTTTMGDAMFATADADLQLYDFHLKPTAAAVGRANSATSLPLDRDARPRDEQPDLGCYEAEAKE